MWYNARIRWADDDARPVSLARLLQLYSQRTKFFKDAEEGKAHALLIVRTPRPGLIQLGVAELLCQVGKGVHGLRQGQIGSGHYVLSVSVSRRRR